MSHLLPISVFRRQSSTLTAWILFASLAATVLAGTVAFSRAATRDEFVTPVDVRQPRSRFVPAHVVGPSECRNCHRAEYNHWKTTKHAGRAFDLLRTESTAREYAEQLGISQAEIAVDSVCVRCHATPRLDAFGRPDVVAGVSCESCHNPAGGPDGWLNSHAVYGPIGTTRQHESPQHFADRLRRNAAAGKNSPYDLYPLARRCFECHIIGEEALVNVGHSSGTRRFEFAEAFVSEIRHNYHLDALSNEHVSTLWLQQIHAAPSRSVAGRKRMMVVIGAMAELEIALRNLAAATDVDGPYYDSACDRVLDTFEYLAEDIAEEFTVVPSELQEAIEATRPIYVLVDDDDFSLQDDVANCRAAADRVAQAGSSFAMNSDGRGLDELLEPDVDTDR